MEDQISIYIKKIFGESGACEDDAEINQYKHKLDQLAGLIFGFAIGSLIDPQSTDLQELIKVITYMTENKWKISKTSTDNILIRTLLCGVLGSERIKETIKLSTEAECAFDSNKCTSVCVMTTLIINNILKSDSKHGKWIKNQNKIYDCCEKIYNSDTWKFNRSLFEKFNPENRMSKDIEEFKKIKIDDGDKPYEINMMLMIWAVKRITFFMDRLETFDEKNDRKKMRTALKTRFFIEILKMLPKNGTPSNVEFQKTSNCIVLAISGCLLGYSSLPKKLIEDIQGVDLLRNIFINFITN